MARDWELLLQTERVLARPPEVMAAMVRQNPEAAEMLLAPLAALVERHVEIADAATEAHGIILAALRLYRRPHRTAKADQIGNERGGDPFATQNLHRISPVLVPLIGRERVRPPTLRDMLQYAGRLRIGESGRRTLMQQHSCPGLLFQCVAHISGTWSQCDCSARPLLWADVIAWASSAGQTRSELSRRGSRWLRRGLARQFWNCLPCRIR